MDEDNLQTIERTSLEIESPSRDSLEPEDTISDIQLHYQERLKSLYEAPQDSPQIAAATISHPEDRTIDENANNDDAFEFRLFAFDRIKEPAEHTITTPKIRLDSPGSGHDATGFVLPRRLDSSYFAGEAKGQKAQDYQYAAVTPEDVLKYATIKWTGCELPWRVQTIHAPKVMCGPTVRDDQHSATRKRQGKKRRMVSRRRIVQAREREQMARASKEENAEAQKEKRNRRNRERKIKRQKERDRKATERQADG